MMSGFKVQPIPNVYVLYPTVALFSFISNKIVISFAENLKLVKAILCAGLYPNVAKIDHHPKFAR